MSNDEPNAFDDQFEIVCDYQEGSDDADNRAAVTRSAAEVRQFCLREKKTGQFFACYIVRETAMHKAKREGNLDLQLKDLEPGRNRPILIINDSFTAPDAKPTTMPDGTERTLATRYGESTGKAIAECAERLMIIHDFRRPMLTAANNEPRRRPTRAGTAGPVKKTTTKKAAIPAAVEAMRD